MTKRFKLWFDMVRPYLTGDNRLGVYSSKIHVRVAHSSESILCQHRTHSKGRNHVSIEDFGQMLSDPHVPSKYLCIECTKLYKKEDWKNPSSEVQLLMLSNTEL